MNPIIEAIRKEGWKIIKEGDKHKIEAYGQIFPFAHPVAIHLKLYRDEKNPDLKYLHMKAAHDYLWPDTIWHYWTRDRFMQHCKPWKYVSYAGGASSSKSFDTAKIALLFWLANPQKRTVIVASTTLDSLSARVWGYLTALLRDMKVDMPFKYFSGAPPKILYPPQAGTKLKDTIHGIFAVAAKKGSDSDAISTWIGRHPKEGMLVAIDEAPDLPESILTALPNLETVPTFQCMAIGNSLSKFDLHGSLSTPKNGWDSIDPKKDTIWETTQRDGICMFFSCYNSPAIYETDPILKAKLSKFLITKETIEAKEKLYGKDSDSFWRFVLGFWRNSSTDDTVISREFIRDFRVFEKAEWSGLTPLAVCAGLDPAFSAATGGDKCVLRIALLGQTVDGQIVLDYRGEELLFVIPIIAAKKDAAELQIADAVLPILERFRCPLRNLVVDANGQGRAISTVLQLRSGQNVPPIKIYTTRAGNTQVNSFDVVIKTAHELLFSFRQFIENRQIKGLDATTISQLCTRLVIYNKKTFKPELETKMAYKVRMAGMMSSLAHSPDEADAAALALQSAIINFGFTPGQRRDLIKRDSFAIQKIQAFRQAHGLSPMGEVVEQNNPPEATFLGNLEDWRPPFASE